MKPLAPNRHSRSRGRSAVPLHVQVVKCFLRACPLAVSALHFCFGISIINASAAPSCSRTLICSPSIAQWLAGLRHLFSASARLWGRSLRFLMASVCLRGGQISRSTDGPHFSNCNRKQHWVTSLPCLGRRSPMCSSPPRGCSCLLFSSQTFCNAQTCQLESIRRTSFFLRHSHT